MLYYLPSSQKGLTLIEAAVSAAVVGVSLLGVLRLQTQLSKDNADSPVRTAALNAAQQKIEELRTFQRVSGIESYERLSCGTDDPMADPDTTPLTNATLNRVCTVGAEVNGYKPVTVTVSWTDTRGEQTVRLSSYIAKTDPVKAGELLASFNSSTITPTSAPTEAPTQAPTSAPTEAPTQAPTSAPTEAPTQAPTSAPIEPSVISQKPAGCSITPSATSCCSVKKGTTFDVVFWVDGSNLSSSSFFVSFVGDNNNGIGNGAKNGNHIYSSSSKTVTQSVTAPSGNRNEFTISLTMLDSSGISKRSDMCFKTTN